MLPFAQMMYGLSFTYQGINVVSMFIIFEFAYQTKFIY